MAHFDVVVCGLGAMGSAALHHLARRGKRVLGLERHSPGHDRGSSHGSTRIIRLGYFEHPSYVPLLRRAYAQWRELETAAGRRLLHVTGIAEIGPPSGTLVQGTLASAHLSTDQRASSDWDTSSTPPTFRCCGAPTRYGASSKQQPAGACST